MGFRKLAVLVTETGAKPLSCPQRTSVLPGVMGVGTKRTRCNELRCQEARLGEETQISSLVKPAGEEDGKGTHGGKEAGRRLGSWGLSSEPTPRTTACRTRKQVSAHSLSLSKHRHPLPALPSRHLVTVDGDFDRHFQRLVGHASHRLHQGHENQGEPHEEDQSKCGDASKPILHSPLLRPPRRLGVFLQEWRVAGQARQMWTQGRQVGE